MSARPSSLWRWTGIAVFMAIVLGLPFAVRALFHNDYPIFTVALIGINSIVAVGLCLLMGYAGQVSLGHAAFYGLGAYTSGILATRLGWSPWLTLPVAIGGTCLIAYLVGVPTLRLRGHYLAMGTLGFGVIVSIVIGQYQPLTGGNSGLTDIPGLSVGGMSLGSNLAFYYLAYAVLGAILLFSSNVAHSRAGRALRAVHGSELAAATSGVDIARYKIKVFVLSAGFASLAGFLYAHCVRFISPELCSFPFSIELVVMVVLGGVGSVWGGLLGAAVITLLAQLLQGRNIGDYSVIIFGLVLMVVMIAMPTGMIGLLASLVKTLSSAVRRSQPAGGR